MLKVMQKILQLQLDGVYKEQFLMILPRFQEKY